MNNKGFTIIELITTMVVLGIVMALVYQHYFVQERALREQRQWSELNTKARKASNYIGKQLRMIGFSDATGASESFGILTGQDNSIVYSHDVKGANAGQVDLNDIHSITLQGDSLFIDGDFALDFVDSLKFIYIETDEDTASTPVSEVDSLGQWILPAGNQVIAYVVYRVILNSPYQKDRYVKYSGLANIRNFRP